MKKFSAILVCLLMIITCGLAGCATFSINKVKYYNEVLATVGKTEITRFDLLTAYNSYGESYFVQQQSKTETEALNETLNLLIDRELLYQYALENEGTYKPTKHQINDIVDEMFSSLDEQMSTYTEKAKTILNIKAKEEEKEEEKEETAYKLADYTYKKRAFVKEREVVKNGVTTVEYYIDYNENYYDTDVELTDNNTKIAIKYINNFKLNGIINEIQNKYLQHFKTNLEIEEKENATAIYNQVIALFTNNLIEYEYYLRDENNKPYSKTTNDLIYRYIERTFNSQLQSQYIENIRIDYLKKDNLNIDLLVKEYNYLANVNYNTYNYNHTAYQNKMKDIGTDGDSVLFHPDTDVKFGYFIHTLISFDDIKDRLTAIKENVHDYDAQYANIVNSLKIKPRNTETGLVDENTTAVELATILSEYNEITEIDNYDDKLAAFINFMFKYTGDTATLNQGMPYVIGYNPQEYTGELENDKLVGTYSAMVTEFTKESINLMQQTKGSMSTVDLTSDDMLDNICITEYGIHLLFYVGDVNSFDIPYQANVSIETNPADYIVEDSTYNLYKKVINPLTKQTYFDMMFDLVYPASSGEVYTSNNGYSEYEEDLTDELSRTYKVTTYKTKIKATKTSL